LIVETWDVLYDTMPIGILPRVLWCGHWLAKVSFSVSGSVLRAEIRIIQSVMQQLSHVSLNTYCMQNLHSSNWAQLCHILYKITYVLSDLLQEVVMMHFTRWFQCMVYFTAVR